MRKGFSPITGLLSALLFAIGAIGVLVRRNVILVLMSLELMAVSVNLNMIALSRFITPTEMTGQFFAIFTMVVSAAEIGLGLALVLAIYRQSHSIELSSMDRLKG